MFPNPETLKAARIGAATRARVQEQAREQLRERRTGVPTRTLLPPAKGLDELLAIAKEPLLPLV